MPSRKWCAARVTGLTGLAVSIATAGWHVATTIALITLVSEALLAYLLPNVKRPRRPVQVTTLGRPDRHT